MASKNGKTVYSKVYRSFLGVDFSKDASMVDDSRSPDAENIISDLDGFPEKRLGWRTIEKFEGRINGIFTFGDPENPCTVIHSGSDIYKMTDGSVSKVYAGCNDAPSSGKYFKGKLCILTGHEFLVFDGESCYRAALDADMYASITHIQRIATPCDYNNFAVSSEFKNWWDYGFVPYEDQPGCVPEVAEINLVSGRRKNTFELEQSSGYATMFVLDAKIAPGSRVVMRYIPTGEVLFDIPYRKDEMYRDGYYTICDGRDFPKEEIGGVDTDKVLGYIVGSGSTKTYVWLGNSEKNGCGFVACTPNISALAGYVHIPGIDDFSIEFTHEVEGYAERIEKCRFMDVFENRVFFSGNPDYPNVDWHSAVNDPLFVPDINYTEIGLSSSRIMGYLRTGGEQAIIKSDGDGASIYMRSYQMLSDGNVIFPVKQGTGGLGAVSGYAITSFLDDPVFLTRNGVYAIAMQDISSERVINIRSTRINSRLLDEKSLENAIMCEWNGLLLLCVDGKCYVADAAKKTYSGNKTGTFEYEWYYWTNIPAICFCESFGELLFGTEDGRLCRFNDDMKNERGETDCRAYADDGEAICARWSTPLSDDGDFMRKKTMLKTGSGVFLKSYNRSGVEVSIRTDSGEVREIVKRSAGIFNFGDIDFNDFTFNTSPYTVVPFNTRIKKYKAIQIICKNDKVNHAFGIGGIVRKFFYGKTNK